MGSTENCPVCGNSVTVDAPQGLCPECLIKTGLETRSANDPAAGKPRFVAPSAEEVARLFPQLEIIELLGQGGMGAVYKARQPRLDRFVALKILAPEKQTDPQFAERFEREARTLASLNQPNIVTVYDFGDVQGNYYLLMEFVDGMNLRRLYQTRRFSTSEALTLVSKICDALQYAHEQGIVHRDIKPENILIDKKGQVKIADFGIAKILDLEIRDLSLTEAWDVVGTPHYMAPEQIETPQAVDCRADIYSLGVVFYEMLTGELPLGKFQLPSQKAAVDIRLDHVVTHALEKEPDRRYQHVTEVKTDVDTIATTAGRSIAPNVSPTLTARKSRARTATIVAGVASLLVLFLVAYLLASMFAGGSSPMAWWRAEGNAIDSAGKNGGLAINNVKFAPGFSGQAFQLDGRGSYVKIPATPQLNPGNKLTIEFWINADAASLKSYAGLVASDFYLVEISSGQHGRVGINFAISTDSGKSLAQTADANNGGAVVLPNQWHFIVAVYDGRDLQLYVDGRPAGKAVSHSGAISPMPPNGFLTIGSEDGRTTRPHCIGTRYFNGLIDEVEIFSRALSPRKIEADYQKALNSRD